MLWLMVCTAGRRGLHNQRGEPFHIFWASHFQWSVPQGYCRHQKVSGSNTPRAHAHTHTHTHTHTHIHTHAHNTHGVCHMVCVTTWSWLSHGVRVVITGCKGGCHMVWGWFLHYTSLCMKHFYISLYCWYLVLHVM